MKRSTEVAIWNASHASVNLFDINGNVNMRHQPVRDGTEWTSAGWYQDSVDRNTVSGDDLTAYYDESTSWGNGQLIDVTPGKTYSFSAKVTSYGTGNLALIRIDIEPEGVQTSGSAYQLTKLQFETLNTVYSKQVTIPAGIDKILLAFYSKNGNNAVFTDIDFHEVFTRTTKKRTSKKK